MGTRRLILLCIALGTVSTLSLAWVLAALMPLEMYPRQVSYHFVAGGRPWGAAERRARGAWNLWWDELNEEAFTPRTPPGSTGAGGAEGSAWPATPEGWVEYAMGELAANKPPGLALVRGAPSWGTFAGGGSPPRTVASGADHGFGWPLPALWYQVTGTTKNLTATATAIDGGIMLTGPATLDLRAYGFRALPARVLWRGLAVDALIAGAFWWVFLFVPRAIARRRRRSHGRCVACGYDLRGVPPGSPCPECGRGFPPGPRDT